MMSAPLDPDVDPPRPPTGPPSTDDALERRWRLVESKLHRARFWLTRQGGLIRKPGDGSRAHWRVRFVMKLDEGHRHASIYLGADPEIVRRARATLATFRAEGAALDAIRRWPALAAKATPIRRNRSGRSSIRRRRR